MKSNGEVLNNQKLNLSEGLIELDFLNLFFFYVNGKDLFKSMEWENQLENIFYRFRLIDIKSENGEGFIGAEGFADSAKTRFDINYNGKVIAIYLPGKEISKIKFSLKNGMPIKIEKHIFFEEKNGNSFIDRKIVITMKK